MTVIHLCDDATPGGVTRVLDRLARLPGDHRIRQIPRGRRMGRLDARVIVSHLAVNWRTLPALFMLRFANPHAVLIHVEHSYTESFAALRVARPRRFRALLRTAYALFDRVVAVSAAQGDWLARLGGLPEGHVSVVRPAVDLSDFAALPAPSGPVRIIGAIGRLDVQKGFDVLIHAFRGLPGADLRLHVAGEGPERARLEALAAGDDRIVFLGRCDPVRAMAGMDAVAMPSRWEAFGLVGLEARAAGRPLLAARVDGLRDQIAAGATPVAPGVTAWRAALGALVRGGGAPRTHDLRAEAIDAERRFADAWSALCAPGRAGADGARHGVPAPCGR